MGKQEVHNLEFMASCLSGGGVYETQIGRWRSREEGGR